MRVTSTSGEAGESAAHHGECLVLHTRIEKNAASVVILTAVLPGAAAQRQLHDSARAFLTHFLEVHERTYPDGLIYAVDLHAGGSVDTKMQQSLQRAREGDAVIYFCGDPAVREIAVSRLGLDAAVAREA